MTELWVKAFTWSGLGWYFMAVTFTVPVASIGNLLAALGGIFCGCRSLRIAWLIYREWKEGAE